MNNKHDHLLFSIQEEVYVCSSSMFLILTFESNFQTVSASQFFTSSVGRAGKAAHQVEALPPLNFQKSDRLRTPVLHELYRF